jgi:hypothetical protein
LWLLPLAEQLMRTPGNLTRIWQFFFSNGTRQPLLVALRAWLTMLLGPFGIDFTLAWGGPFEGSSNPVTLAGGAIVALAPAAVVAPAWRAGRRFEAMLALSCLVASSIGLWSVLNIRTPIGDYHIFWLSVIGALSGALAVAALMRAISDLDRATWRLAVARLTLVCVFATTLFIGYRGLRDAGSGGLDPNGRLVRRIAESLIDRLPSTGGNRPHIRVEGSLWVVTTGLLVQLSRTSVKFTLHDDLIDLFGPHLHATGLEDLLVTVSDPDHHRELAERPGNRLLTSDDQEGVFVDVVSLVDYPQYRDER